MQDLSGILTTRLNGWGGRALVLAKPYKGDESDLSAVGYANRTQAEKRCEELRAQGYDCHVRSFVRPFYIVFAE